MSDVAEAREASALSPAWERLERAVREASAAVPAWRRRALEAEDELARLRHALEAIAAERDGHDESGDELRRLRAENAALRSRMTQARKRVHVLLTRLASLAVQR